MKWTGGWSGNSATVSTGSGGDRRRLGRGQCAGQVAPTGGASGAIPANRALGEIALRGRCAVELVGTYAVGEDVDQIRDVRVRSAA